MPAKGWKLVVTELKGGDPLSEVTTEGDNWMQALAAGRTALGEEGVVPPGASCVPGADGGVTVLDPQARRRYVLTPAATEAAAPETPAASELAASETPASPGRKKRRQHTVAYMPSPVAEAAEPAKPAGGGVPKRTMAYTPPSSADASTDATPSKEVAVGTPSPGAAPPSPSRDEPTPPPAPKPEGPRADLVKQRKEDPSADNPLRYREQVFAVPEGTSRAQAEAVARAQLATLQRELADAPVGKFFSITVVDERYRDRPERSALVTLRWKDWRGEPIVEYPADQPPGSGPAKPPRSRSGINDGRLSQAFEACEDIPFLASASEGMRFAAKLLEELVPSEAITGFLHDEASGEQRVVFASGPGGEGLQGRGIPARSGAMGAAAEASSQVLRVDDASADGRFDPGVDGRVGLEVRNALYAPLVHEDRLVGMIQLLNRQEQAHFAESDAEVTAYVASRLAGFVTSAAS
ncbi:MAG: GAF domain-containing protein [Myxococcota bacterium]